MLSIDLPSMLQPNITFVMIKADAIRNKVSDDIVRMIIDNGFNIVHSGRNNISEISYDQINNFYKEHIGKHYFHELFQSIACGARPFVVEYPFYDIHAWKKMRELIGSTNSRKAEPDTIRGKFGGHIYSEDAPMAANAIHASDSLESVIREVKIIFPDLKEFVSTNHGDFTFNSIRC